LLAEAFLDEIGQSIGRPAAGLFESARERLLAHAWPGNVRELRNAIERAVILCEGGLVAAEHMPMTVGRPSVGPLGVPGPGAVHLPAEGVRLDQVERDLLVKALARADNNKSRAAKLLGARAASSTRSCAGMGSRRPVVDAARAPTRRRQRSSGPTRARSQYTLPR